MTDKPVVETVYGTYHKYEIVKDSGGVFGSVKFYLRKDGKPFKGAYTGLTAAVEAAKNEG